MCIRDRYLRAGLIDNTGTDVDAMVDDRRDRSKRRRAKRAEQAEQAQETEQVEKTEQTPDADEQ